MPSVLGSLITELKKDAVILIRRPSSIVAMSDGAIALCEKFGVSSIISLALVCGEEEEVEFLKCQSFIHAEFKLVIMHKTSVHLKMMLEAFGVGLLLVNIKTNDNCLVWTTEKYAELVGVEHGALKRIGTDAIAARVPLEDRQRVNPVFIDACLDLTPYSVATRVEVQPNRLVWRRFHGNCHLYVDDWIGSSIIVQDCERHVRQRKSRRLAKSVALMLQTIPRRVIPLNIKDSWRSLGRDCLFALSSANLVSISENGWLVPIFQPADMSSVQEELMNGVPHKLRAALITAMSTKNYPLFASVAKQSPLSLVSCFYRWLAGSVARDETGAIVIPRVLSAMADMQIDDGVYQYTWALTQLSVAILNADLYLNSMQPVVRLLRQALNCHQQEVSDWQEPVKFWLLLLWGCLLKRMGLSTESTKLLHALFYEMQTFAARYPVATSVGRMQAVVAHNLIHQYANNPQLASVWIAKLKGINAFVPIPDQCNDTLFRLSPRMINI